VDFPARSTRALCSNRCRQAAYRAARHQRESGWT
jgi:hypothetical protein